MPRSERVVGRRVEKSSLHADALLQRAEGKAKNLTVSDEERLNRFMGKTDKKSAQPRAENLPTEPLRARSDRAGALKPPSNEGENKRRQAALQRVYREFDLDSNGGIGFDEMLVLGQTRRKLSQKQGDWTREMNRSLMDRIGPNAKDELPEANFVKYFNSSLPTVPSEFDKSIDEFIECARLWRKKQIEMKRLEIKANKNNRTIKEVSQRQELAFFAKAQDPSPRSASKSSPSTSRERSIMLEGLFAELDIDRSGSISTSEFYFVGKCFVMRYMGLESWTWEHNMQLVKQLTGRSDGTVQQSEFVKYLVELLASGTWETDFEELCNITRMVRNYYKSGIFEEELSKLRKSTSSNLLSPRSPRRSVSPRHSSEQTHQDSKRKDEIGDAKLDRRREVALQAIYREFELSGGTGVGFEALYALGLARRKLGQEHPVWTREKNQELMDKIGYAHRDQVSQANFVSHFNTALPHDMSEFDKIIRVFRSCAQESRQNAQNSSNDNENKRRQSELQRVYREFDLDGDGGVGFDEMLVLGQTRRKLGQKQGEWTRDMNSSLMDRIGSDAKGDLPESNFVKYFNGTLSNVPAEFDKTIEDFIECARQHRKKKLEERAAPKRVQEDAAQAKRQAEEEARRRKAAEEDAAAARRRKAEDDASRRKMEDEEAARKRKAEDDAAAKRRKAAEDDAEARRRKAEEDDAAAARRRKIEDDAAAARRQAADEAAEKRRADDDARRRKGEDDARRQGLQQDRDRERLEQERNMLGDDHARLKREKAAFEREREAWERMKEDQAHEQRMEARRIRSEIEDEVGARFQKKQADLEREGAARLAQLQQQHQDELTDRNRKQRESADSDRDEKLALKERIAILETEIWRLKESEQHSTRLKREEYQISATRILALALKRWRHVLVRRCLRRWNMNAMMSHLYEHQIDVTEYRMKYQALLRFLTIYVTHCLRGLINMRMSTLVNIWARRAVSNACQVLEWRLSQAKQLMPEFVPEIRWEWEDVKQKWHCYSRENCWELEVGLAKNPDQSVNIKDGGNMYKVWLNSRKHVDVMSGESRPCRRRAPTINFVTVAAGVRKYLIDCEDNDIGFRGRMDQF